MPGPQTGVIAALRAAIAGVLAYFFARIAAAALLSMLEYVIFRGELWALSLLVLLAASMAIVVMSLRILADSLRAALDSRR